MTANHALEDYELTSLRRQIALVDQSVTLFNATVGENIAYGKLLGKATKEEIEEASGVLFEKVTSGKVKVDIFKEYKLENAVEAHKDLEGRKILGPAVIIP